MSTGEEELTFEVTRDNYISLLSQPTPDLFDNSAQLSQHLTTFHHLHMHPNHCHAILGVTPLLSLCLFCFSPCHVVVYFEKPRMIP